MSLFRLFGFGRKTTNTAVKQISVRQAYDLTKTGAVTLIDVRRPEEWNETGRPARSHGLTLQDPEFAAKLLMLMGGDKKKPVAFTCRSGARSSQSAQMAKAAGHSDIANVEGGFQAWAMAGLPVDFGPF